MNILLVHSLIRLKDNLVTFGAVEYHRMQKPHEVLCRTSDNYSTLDNIDNVDDDFLKKYDLIIFCRKIENAHLTAERLNKLGVKFGLDIDDYWHLPEDHILNPFYKQYDVPLLIETSLRLSHFVIVTTPILADKVRPFNKNIFIIENGIDLEDQVWKPNKKESERLRYGFTQGTTHIPDIMLINKEVSKSLYDSKFYHKCQVTLCGFSAERNKGSIYVGYEKLLTDELKTLKFFPSYVSSLKLLLFPEGQDMPYRRIKSKDVDEFACVYDEIDISVAPLKVSEFNSCKSNLKMIEAGFKDCAVMVSEVDPYTPLANKNNSFLLSEKNFFEWQRYILLNPSIVEDKKEQLKEDVKPYSLQNLSKKRRQVYESCIGM